MPTVNTPAGMGITLVGRNGGSPGPSPGHSPPGAWPLSCHGPRAAGECQNPRSLRGKPRLQPLPGLFALLPHAPPGPRAAAGGRARYSFKYCFSFTLFSKHGFTFLHVLVAASCFVILVCNVVFNNLSIH